MNMDLPSLPLGKYVDPNTLGKLKTLGYFEINEMEPEFLVLVQDLDNRILYCGYQVDFPPGPSEEPVALMTKFASIAKPNCRVEILKPKNNDYFEDWIIGRII